MPEKSNAEKISFPSCFGTGRVCAGQITENLYLACAAMRLGCCAVGFIDQEYCTETFGLDGNGMIMKKICLYNVDMEQKKGRRLRSALDALPFAWEVLPEKSYFESVGKAAGLPDFSAGEENEIDSLNGEVGSRKVYRNEFMLICGLDKSELDMLLDVMHRNNVSIGLKAVLTDTNAKWKMCDLIEELIKEREVMKRYKKSSEKKRR